MNTKYLLTEPPTSPTVQQVFWPQQFFLAIFVAQTNMQGDKTCLTWERNFACISLLFPLHIMLLSVLPGQETRGRCGKLILVMFSLLLLQNNIIHQPPFPHVLCNNLKANQIWRSMHHPVSTHHTISLSEHLKYRNCNTNRIIMARADSVLVRCPLNKSRNPKFKSFQQVVCWTMIKFSAFIYNFLSIGKSNWYRLAQEYVNCPLDYIWSESTDIEGDHDSPEWSKAVEYPTLQRTCSIKWDLNSIRSKI